ncbi:hypothetical protein GCM10011379_17080 [Filimonas zeae]|uniref:Fibronectin type-III domain-containing protein n=2 Tax=Filimonas zeae TaxID=1737353 RepID=A0A917IVZ5_9BACT|nr:hypothetical protein GCM10011379_17080 [Filimonas zeae]
MLRVLLLIDFVLAENFLNKTDKFYNFPVHIQRSHTQPLAMLKHAFFCCCILMAVCCQKKDTVLLPDDPAVITVPGLPDLQAFHISITERGSTTAAFQWNEAGDYQSDSVIYTLELNGKTIVTGLQKTEYRFTDLEPATTYTLKVKALAGKAPGTVSTSFQFTTDDGYLKFAKSLFTNVSPYDLVATPDNGYVVCMFYGTRNALVVARLDSLGNEKWRKMYPYRAIGTRILATGDGYVIMGSSYLLKLDGEGNTMWYREFNYSEVAFQSFIRASNGDLLVTGFDQGLNNPKMYMIASVRRLNAQGELKWRKTYGTTLRNQGNDIIFGKTEDEIYVYGSKALPVAGWEDGNTQRWLFRIDGAGNFLWEADYGDSKYDFSTSLIRVGEHLILGGFRLGIGQISEKRIIRTDLSGNVINTIQVGLDEFYGTIVKLLPTPDNGYIACTWEGNYSRKAMLWKYDASDKVEWSGTYLGSNYEAMARSVIQTADGGYCMAVSMSAGYNINSVLWLLKLNPTGFYE